MESDRLPTDYQHSLCAYRYKAFRDLHDKYGEVVRLGPRSISISNKEMIRQALVTEDLPKGPLYKLFQREGVQTLFSTMDQDWHKKRRRIVSPAFSIKYLNSLEPFMVSVTESLIKKLDADIAASLDEAKYGTVDIWNMVQRLALDVIGETAFGQSFHMVENNSHFVPGAIAEQMRLSAVSVVYPLLSKLFIKNAGKNNPQLTKFLNNVIEERLHNKESQERKDILQFLINSSQQQAAESHNDKLTAEAIMSETVLFLVAGSETTSNTIGFVFIELLNYPEHLKKLYEEIDTVEWEEGQHVFHHNQIKHLPYLNAVINETLRLDAVAAGALHRMTVKPTVLGHLSLPARIHVNCNIWHAQTSDKYYPDPWAFHPERWIEGTDDLEAFFPFSAGSRNCIGKNFAMQEMRIAIATLLKTYDIAPIPQEMEDATSRRHFITMTVQKNSFKIKMKRRI
ncbi:cytochrome P450 [Mycotypha africana]|uniref:cytochrome P450 n=1 Tax=Mycotypha africana TaxID=64632 RepID=UPI00230130B8|nr:cytochrome P450 [Mycotypha africana]KAI8982259.1 cytochrome P450 [Mycotypha africana]